VVSVVLVAVTACHPGAQSKTPLHRDVGSGPTSSVASVGVPTTDRRIHRSEKKRTGTSPTTRRRALRNKFHGDGLSYKGLNKCSNMPFPGPIITVFRMHECWEGVWHSRPGRLNDLMYMLGYKPGTHRRRQQMIVGLANGPTRVVNLRSDQGMATLAHFGRMCGVIRYSDSTHKTYYMPFRHKIVRHCRWKH
jgi:hypothetical protein